jgi:hypothetical protein
MPQKSSKTPFLATQFWSFGDATQKNPQKVLILGNSEL